jgi:hypothetical protein
LLPLRTGRTEIHAEFWLGNIYENCLFDDQEGYARILRWILPEEDCDYERRKEQTQDRIQRLLNLNDIDPS